jgi:hypothetical protein
MDPYYGVLNWLELELNCEDLDVEIQSLKTGYMLALGAPRRILQD